MNSCNTTNEQLYIEQISLLYHNAPLAYAFTLINGLILVFVQRTYTTTSILIVWFICLVLITVSRANLVYLFANSHITAKNANYWNYAYLIGTGLAGITWGSSAIFLFPVESISHQEFIVFILADMSAGGVAVLSARFEACLVFLLPTLLPLAVRFFIVQENELHILLAMITLIFLGGMLSTAWTMHQSILTSLKLRLDKRELLAEMAKRQQVEERLFQEKERLQTTLASLGEGVIITHADATIEYLNPMAERFSGWSSKEVCGRPINEVFQSSHEKTEQMISTAVEKCLQSAASSQQQAVLVTRAGQNI